MLRSAAVAAAPVALAFLLGPTAAFAQVTAAEVWDEMKSMMGAYGQEVSTGSETYSGGTLTVRNLVVDLQVPEGSASAALDELSFVEKGDGTVAVTISPEYRIVTSIRPEAGEAVEMRMAIRQSGLSMLVSGDAATRTYDLAADTVTLDFEELVADGEAVPFNLTLTAGEPTAQYIVKTETVGRALQSTSFINAVRVEGDIRDPAGSDNFRFNMEIAELESTSSGFLPNAVSFAAGDLDALLKAGFQFAGTATSGASTFDFAGDIEGSQSASRGSSAGGTFDIEMSRDTLRYGVTSQAGEMYFRSSDLPLPEIAVTYESSAFDLRLPASATDTPRDIALVAALRGLTVSDSIWALFDPMGVLPRDPATVSFDLGGQAKWLIDIFSPEAAGMTAAPGELNSLTLNGLEVSLAGAELTGSGAFVFDNADTTTFEGMPKPEGAADFRLVGGNGLLDKLVAMGLIPEDEAMGMRMMLGLFARPGDGEDTLVSKIEVNAEGQVLANGQRLR